MLPGGGPGIFGESHGYNPVKSVSFVILDPQVQGTLLRLSNTTNGRHIRILSSGLIGFLYPPSTLTFGLCAWAQACQQVGRADPVRARRLPGRYR